MYCTFIIFLLLVIFITSYFSLKICKKYEGFANKLDYGYLDDNYAKGNPISYDMRVPNIPEQKKYPKPTGMTYFGHGIPLANEEYKTELEKPSVLQYADRQCRADCCTGPLVVDYSCSHGCVCNQ